LQNLSAARLTRYLTALSPKEGFLDAWRRILAQMDMDGERGAAVDDPGLQEPQEETKRA
jgi:hypothetical protein